MGLPYGRALLSHPVPGSEEVSLLHYTRYRIPLFFAVTTLYWFSLYTYAPFLAPYAESVGASYRMIGWIAGSYGLSQLVLRIPIGMASDLLQRRKLFVVIGAVLASGAGIGLYLSTTPLAVLVFRFMSGVAASMWVAYTVLYSSYFDSGDAPRAIAVINGFNALGQVSAILTGGLLAQVLEPRVTFLLAAMGGALGSLLSLGIVETGGDRGSGAVLVRRFGSVIMHRSLLTVSGLAVLSQVISFGTVFGFTPVAAKAIGASSMQLSVLTTLSVLPSILAAPLSGTLFARTIGERATVAAGFSLFSVSAMLVPFAASVSVLYVLQLVGGFGRGMSFPLLMGLSIKSIEREARASAMGVFQAIYALGMFVGPVLVGVIGQSIGLAWGFVLTGVLGLCGAALSWLLLAKKQTDPEMSGVYSGRI